MPEFDPVESPDASTIFEYHDLEPPTVADIYRARQAVYRHLPATPLVKSPWLSAELDADVYLKREDTLPIGAFKVRGGINLVESLDQRFVDTGLIAASTGNHGQSIAYAGRAAGVPVIICVPDDANPGKVNAMERLGAEVVHHGDDFDEAREHAETLAAERGYRYVHSANEPALIAGIGTAGLEILETVPEIDVLVSPVGGGSSASAYCLTVGALGGADVIGVQSAEAPAMYHAWDDDTLTPHERMETFAEGLATRVPFATTVNILREHLTSFELVDDTALQQGITRMLEEEHILIEGATAAGVAVLLDQPTRFQGSTVVLPISGRNLSVDKLADLINA